MVHRLFFRIKKRFCTEYCKYDHNLEKANILDDLLKLELSLNSKIEISHIMGLLVVQNATLNDCEMTECNLYTIVIRVYSKRVNVSFYWKAVELCCL